MKKSEVNYKGVTQWQTYIELNIFWAKHNISLQTQIGKYASFLPCHQLFPQWMVIERIFSLSGSPCRYSAASKAFLFSLYNIDGYAPVNLTQYSYANQAMYGCSSYGPTFGGHDVFISDDAVNNNQSYTHCGHTYSAPPGYSTHSSCPFFAGSFFFSPTDIEVFYETST